MAEIVGENDEILEVHFAVIIQVADDFLLEIRSIKELLEEDQYRKREYHQQDKLEKKRW